MLQTEFIRNLHNNYERLLLEEKPEERRYQYCILSRGGIHGLLPCSLRYINNQAFLYYDITSRQNVTQIFERKKIDRQWICDFMESRVQLQLELDRFLLDERNILWYPDQIFQDLDAPEFSFLYVPYYQGESGFRELLEFWIERLDYEDEQLVECVYKIFERYEQSGDAYLQERMAEDVRELNGSPQKKTERVRESEAIEVEKKAPGEGTKETARELWQEATASGSSDRKTESKPEDEYPGAESETLSDKKERRGIFGLWENRRKKNKEAREQYRESQLLAMAGFSRPESPYGEELAVAEETDYMAEDCGQTMYVEDAQEPHRAPHRLCTPSGKLLARLEGDKLIIGKKQGEVDLLLEDVSVSRVHARLLVEEDGVYLQDLNARNGTFKNGLRLQPYEKRRLDEEDEIRIGQVVLIYR